eukprot:5445905-Prymnesium_polylepis.1
MHHCPCRWMLGTRGPLRPSMASKKRVDVASRPRKTDWRPRKPWSVQLSSPMLTDEATDEIAALAAIL